MGYFFVQDVGLLWLEVQPNRRSTSIMLVRTKMVNRDKIEKFLIEKIKDNIPTEQNLTKLMKLTNAEPGKSKRQYDEELKVREHQINK